MFDNNKISEVLGEDPAILSLYLFNHAVRGMNLSSARIGLEALIDSEPIILIEVDGHPYGSIK